MILLFAFVVAALVGAGAFLMLQRDLFRVSIGTVLISNGAIIFIMANRLTRGPAPIHPIAVPVAVSDPLVQSLALTAVVISFGISTLVLALVWRVWEMHRSIDQEDLEAAERRDRESQEAQPEAG